MIVLAAVVTWLVGGVVNVRRINCGEHAIKNSQTGPTMILWALRRET